MDARIITPKKNDFISRIGSDRMIAGAGFIFILFTVTVGFGGNFIITCGNVLLNFSLSNGGAMESA